MEVSSRASTDTDVLMVETDVEAVETDVETKSIGSPATILSEKTLLVGRVGDGDWVRLNRGATVGPGVSISCATVCFKGI